MRKRDGKESMYSYAELLAVLKSSFFLIGVSLAVFVWVIDPIIDAVFLGEETIVQRLFSPDAHEVYMRTIISAVIIIYSFIGSFLLKHFKQAETSLKISEQRFRKLFDENPAMLFTVDEIGTLISVNQFGIAQLGYTIEQLVEQPVTNMFHEEDRFLAQENLKQCFAEPDKVHRWELRKICHDGRVIWVRETARMVFDADGKRMVLIVCDENVTERHRLKERFQQVFNNSPNALIISNEQGEITLTNSSTTTMFGYESDQLIGMCIEDLMPERYRGHHPKLRQGYISDSSPRPMGAGRELYGLRKDGIEFPIEIGLNIIESDSESLVLGTVTDITERKKKAEQVIRFSRIFEDSLNEIYLFTADTLKFEQVNNAALQNLGYTMEELRELTPLSIKPEFTHELFEELIAPLRKGEKEKIIFETTHQRKDKSLYDVEIHLQLIKYGHEALFTAMILDITERKKGEAKLSYQSSHDALTGLINRREFERRTERLLSSIKQVKAEHALCYMDLDQFKVVNDTCGHAAGDELLRQLGTVLQEVVRHRDTLARLGGDEFGVLMEHCPLDDAHRVATAIQTAIQDFHFLWEGRSFRVGASMGLVPITNTTPNLTELLKGADAACYMAKDKGRNRIHVHHRDDKALSARHGEMQWVSRLQHALAENRFCLYAQAIAPLNNSQERHYELLVRMLDEEGNLVPPGAFLPAAERYNLITQLDKWVVENAFLALKANPAFLEQINFISINLSGQSLADADFLNFVVEQFHDHEIDGEKICFEITETAAISNLSKADHFISELRQFGCRFALDDFGSGLSSFGYLKSLPVDYLKIDGLFVKDMVNDPIDHAMVKSINEIGQVMGMQTIAEFVENDEIKGMLREIGVNYAQGYGIHKPEPLDKLMGLV